MKTQPSLGRTIGVIMMLLVVEMPGAGAATTAPAPQAPAAGAKPALKQEELDQVLAPVALYPDALLSQVLMASTYPLEVVQADRWVKQNPGLKGEALAAALEKQGWDPSVKSLVNFPQVLSMMSEQLEWTSKLGDVFLADQKAVMQTVQKLRAKAEVQGNLKSGDEQKVAVETQGTDRVIVIEQANPEVLYVPVYNPTVVYGDWWWPSYPPYYGCWAPGFYVGNACYGFGWGIGFGVAWGWAWGGCDWNNCSVNVNCDRNSSWNKNHVNRDNFRGGNWQQNNGKAAAGTRDFQHDPSHRQGVAYRDRATAQRFNPGGTDRANQSREAFRGRADAGRQELTRNGFNASRTGSTSTTGQAVNRQTGARTRTDQVRTTSNNASNAAPGANRSESTRGKTDRLRTASNTPSQGANRSEWTRGRTDQVRTNSTTVVQGANSNRSNTSVSRNVGTVNRAASGNGGTTTVTGSSRSSGSVPRTSQVQSSGGSNRSSSVGATSRSGSSGSGGRSSWSSGGGGGGGRSGGGGGGGGRGGGGGGGRR